MPSALRLLLAVSLPADFREHLRFPRMMERPACRKLPRCRIQGQEVAGQCRASVCPVSQFLGWAVEEPLGSGTAARWRREVGCLTWALLSGRRLFAPLFPPAATSAWCASGAERPAASGRSV